MTRIVTWNVNSVRSRAGRVLAWLEEGRPDIVLLEETRCSELPPALAAAGYEAAHHLHGGRNGVAILSRVGLSEVDTGFDHEGRLLSATCGGLRIHSVYVPNGHRLGTPHWHAKLAWLARLAQHLATAADLGPRARCARPGLVTPLNR